MHWFVVKQLEQIITERLGQVPSTAAQIAAIAGVDQDAVGEQLHGMKMRGLLERSELGVWNIKKLNGAHAGAPEIINKKENVMTEKPTPATTKTCSRCRKSKPLDQMRSNGQCKACGKEYDRARLAAKKAEAAGGAKPAKKLASKRVAKYQHGVGPDPLGRMVVNLFSIRITDHAGVAHDLVLNYDVVKQLLIELKDCTS